MDDILAKTTYFLLSTTLLGIEKLANQKTDRRPGGLPNGLST